MKEAASMPHKLNPKESLNLSWRDERYRKFYEVVDKLVHEIQKHVWIKTGKPKRRLKGDGLEKLYYFPILEHILALEGEVTAKRLKKMFN